MTSVVVVVVVVVFVVDKSGYEMSVNTVHVKQTLQSRRQTNCKKPFCIGLGMVFSFLLGGICTFLVIYSDPGKVH